MKIQKISAENQNRINVLSPMGDVLFLKKEDEEKIEEGVRDIRLESGAVYTLEKGYWRYNIVLSGVYSPQVGWV
jgi:hypothetical protein